MGVGQSERAFFYSTLKRDGVCVRSSKPACQNALTAYYDATILGLYDDDEIAAINELRYDPITDVVNLGVTFDLKKNPTKSMPLGPNLPILCY